MITFTVNTPNGNIILLFFAQEDETHRGIYISKIVENSPASAQLQLYDRVLQVYIYDFFSLPQRHSGNNSST